MKLLSRIKVRNDSLNSFRIPKDHPVYTHETHNTNNPSLESRDFCTPEAYE